MFLLATCVSCCGFLGLTACENDGGDGDTNTPTTPATPQKLSAPVVVLEGNEAVWTADSTADKFEISIDGNLSYVENSVTRKTLTNGQTFKIRAVGDGTLYTTSEWSNIVAYILDDDNTGGDNTGGDNTGNTGGNTDGQMQEPTYLGIFASKEEPSPTSGLPLSMASVPLLASALSRGREYRDFNTALKESFENTDNYLGINYPESSDYDIYSTAGATVYIQIWLNNPAQHTILSLKLNGTKYQVGGGLSSFFVVDNGEHYNCVYVAVTIPSDLHTEQEYVVSDIEYIESTYINADGTDEFMNNNDSVLIGLPYQGNRTAVSGYSQQSLTINGYSASFTLTDEYDWVDKSGGWLGVAIYDGEETFEIMKNQVALVGDNQISVTGLVEDSHYTLYVYLFADLHDGNGVRAHYLYSDWITTPQVLTVDEIESTTVRNAKDTGYVGAIKVETTLSSTSAEYVKLEILNGKEEVVYTDENFDGSEVVSQGIYNSTGYTVKVYYKDNEYPDGRYIEEYVYVGRLDNPHFHDEETYAFINDGIYSFQLDGTGGNIAAVDSFTVRFFDEDKASYIAEDVLCLIKNPALIDELWGEWYDLRASLGGYEEGAPEIQAINAEMKEIYDRIQTLNGAQNTWENQFDRSEDVAFWEAEALKGKYYYEYTWAGEDTDNVFYANGRYYVILKNVNETGAHYKIEVVANIAKNEGDFFEEYVHTNFGESFVTLYNEDDYDYGEIGLKDVALDGEEITYTIYNKRDNRADGETTSENRQYIYRIESNGKVLYADGTAVMPVIDEAAWIAEYIQNAKAGELDAVALYQKYVSDYAIGETLTLDLSEMSAGVHRFDVKFRMHGKTYEGGEYDGWYGVYDVEVYKQYEAPTLTIDGAYGYVKTNGNTDGGNLVWEARDKTTQETLEIGSLDWYGNDVGYRFEFAYENAEIHFKVACDSYGEQYWSDSDWTEWQDSEAVKLSAPTFTLDYKTLSWKSDGNEQYVERYVYVINDGEERVGSEYNLSYQYSSCVIKVKAVVSQSGKEAGYCDSDWTTYHYTYSSGGGKDGK